MAVTAVGRQQAGTLKTFKTSGGDAAISMSAVSSAAARQSVKLDFGPTWAQLWAVQATNDLAGPTAGNTVDFFLSPSDSATAGTGNCAGCTGADAAYTGIASNLAASLKLLQYIGSAQCTADVAAQVSHVGTFRPISRYMSLVVVNNSGGAFATSTNSQYVFRPLEDTSEPS